jgi:hypothetical protein
MSEILDRTIQDTPLSELYLRGRKVCANCKWYGAHGVCKKYGKMGPLDWCNAWRKRHV